MNQSEIFKLVKRIKVEQESDSIFQLPVDRYFPKLKKIFEPKDNIVYCFEGNQLLRFSSYTRRSHTISMDIKSTIDNEDSKACYLIFEDRAHLVDLISQLKIVKGNIHYQRHLYFDNEFMAPYEIKQYLAKQNNQ